MIDRFDRFGMSFGHSMGPILVESILMQISGSFSGILYGSFETMQLYGQISSSDPTNRWLGISRTNSGGETVLANVFFAKCLDHSGLGP